MTPGIATAVNLDTVALVTSVAEGSPHRGTIQSYVAGKTLLLTARAEAEFLNALTFHAGPLERARAARLLARCTRTPDGPSPRAMALRPTKNLGRSDMIILGTGDALGVVTVTGDAKAIRAASAQGVDFDVYLHTSYSLTRR